MCPLVAQAAAEQWATAVAHLLHGLQRAGLVDGVAVVVQGAIVHCSHGGCEWHARFSRHCLAYRKQGRKDGTDG